MSKYIKIYGLQRSGTNYLKALLEHHFDVRVLQNIGGWKHGRICNKTDMSKVDTDLTDDDIQFIDSQMPWIPKIYIKKDFGPWLKSYKKYLFGRGGDDLMSVHRAEALYTEMNDHWAQHCHEVKYEVLRENVDRVLEEIRVKFELNYRYRDIKNRMKRGGDRLYINYVSDEEFC